MVKRVKRVRRVGIGVGVRKSTPLLVPPYLYPFGVRVRVKGIPFYGTPSEKKKTLHPFLPLTRTLTPDPKGDTPLELEVRRSIFSYPLYYTSYS